MSVKKLIGFIGVVLICLICAIGIMAIPSLAAQLTDVTNTLSDSTAGSSATHTIAFTVASEIPKTGKIIISFPVGFDVSSVSLGSNLNNFSLSVSGQDINLNRNANVTIPAGTTITIPLYNITNSPASGTYHITVATYQSAHGSVIDGPTNSTEFSINAPEGVIITTYSLPTGQVGTDYSQTLKASGGTAPYSWEIVSGSLPSGLTLDPSTGEISGTPSNGGTFVITVQITDSAATPNSDTVELEIVINTPVTVVADAQTKIYGNTDPDLTFTCSDSSVSFSGALSRDPGEDVGSYAIKQGTLSAGQNYAISFVSADFTITPQPITVKADALTKIYGEADPDLTYKVSQGSLVGADAFSGSLTRNAGDIVGAYAINQGTLNAGSNYDLSYEGADLSIKARPVTVTADAQNKTYGQPDPSLTYRITSGSLAFSDSFNGALDRASGETAGTYSIGQGSLSLSSNYFLTYNEANLIISKATPVITWANPADITNPAPLTSTQLNATSNIPGNFTYYASDSQGNPLNIVNPGTILAAGGHKLWAKLTPTDSTNYNEATASVTLTVKPAGGGSAGGGGGGGNSKGTTAEINSQINLSTYVDTNGLFTQKATASSSDGFCSLIIHEGTIGKTSDGQALSFVTVEPVTNSLQTMIPPPGDSVIGLVYNFGPEGATFDPPINLSLSYNPNQIPAGIPENQLMIGYWDTASQKWVPLSGSQIDVVNHTLTAPLSHFSIYSIIIFQPARIFLSDLTIAPADISTGQTAIINVIVSNSGELSGDYNLNLEVNGQNIETRQVNIPGQSDLTVSFNFLADKAGYYNIQINNLTQVLTVNSLLPVAFADLTIFPAQITSGSPFTIEATAANNNTTAATAKVTLLVDGIAADSQEINLPGNSQSNVTFKMTLSNPGTHSVEIAGLTASLKVLPADSSSFFKVDSLKLSSSIINEGEDVLITALVTNSAETSGTYELILKINGFTSETRQITLAGKTGELVSFKIQPQNSGSYDINLNGLQDNLEVASKAPSWYLILLVLLGVLSFVVTLIFILRRARRYGLYNT